MPDAVPPPGASGVPTPPPVPPRRGPLVTAAGGMLITAGILSILAGVIFVLAGSEHVLVSGERASGAEGTLRIVVGVLDLLAGALVLALRWLGRLLGFAMAGLTGILGLLDLVRGDTRGLLSLLLAGLVIWALIALEPTFRRAREG